MRRLAPTLLMCWALPGIALAGESPSPAISSAALRITLTVPERLRVSTAVVPDKQHQALCLTTDSISMFSVSAVVHDATGWRLAALAPESPLMVTTEDCPAAQGKVYELNPERYASHGIVTLLLSPL